MSNTFSLKPALLFLALLLSLMSVRKSGGAELVGLQNATATFSQTGFGVFPPEAAIDNNDSDNRGWAIYPNVQSQTLVVETGSDIGKAHATVLTFQLRFRHTSIEPFSAHTLGRFRLSATTDPRATFADGLHTGGDVSANWVVLDPVSVTAQFATLTELDDKSLLASGALTLSDAYTVTAVSPLTGITGFRLEALEHPSLPHGGPGREPENGNFVLSELVVMAETPRAGPTIVEQPISQDVLAGEPVRFTVRAEGEGPLTYQWHYNGIRLLGATDASLFLSAVTVFQQGSYSVLVTDANGTAQSVTAMLTVRSPVQKEQLSLQSATATFSQTGAGVFVPEAAIDGSLANNLGWAIAPRIVAQTWAAETRANAGVARATVFIFALYFLHTSDTELSAHPLGRFRLSATSDSRATFADGLHSGGDVSANWVVLDPIEWETDAGAVLSELDDHSLLASGPLSDKELYLVAVVSPISDVTGFRLEALEHPSLPFSGPGREPQNGNFVLTEFEVYADTDLRRLGPVILAHPISQEVELGATATFSVLVDSAGTPRYQWFFNGSPLSNATTPTLAIASVSSAEQGTYTVVITDEFGSVTSRGAVLRLKGVPPDGELRFRNFAPGVLDAPVSDAYGSRVAGPAFLAQLYAGGSDIALQPVGPPVPFGTGSQAGYFDDAVRTIPGAAPGSPQFVSVRAWEAAAGSTYEQAAANNGAHGSSDTFQVTLGGGATAPAELTGLRPITLAGRPRITGQPSGVSTIDRTDFTLSVQAAGTAPLTYLWHKDGTALAGASSASLTVSNATSAHSGTYFVIVANQFGSITSAPAAVLVRTVDRQAPTVTITSPIPGATTADRVILAGRAEDNVGVVRVEWGRNGNIVGELPLTGGAFSVQMPLARGANNLFVRAFDAEGNTTIAEVNLTVDAAREFFLQIPGAAREGSRVTIPIVYRGLADVSGATLNINYPNNFLAEPELARASTQTGMLLTVNTNISGQVRASFALGGATLTEGAFATLSFRVRSVPNATTTDLGLQGQGVFSLAGESITNATDFRGGQLQLTTRRVIGDNNANDTLDVGDASIMLRLITGLDLARTWDIPANDLNRNSQIDPGDVIRVLRAVVQLDPQPVPAPGSILARQSANDAPELLSLSADRERVNVGDQVKVRVLMTGAAPLSGLSFTLDFPPDALRLESATGVRVAPIVPAEALSLWNQQNGSLHFGVSSASLWPNNAGEVVEFTFTITEAARGKTRLPLALHSVRLTDGWLLQDGSEAQLALSAADPATAKISIASRLANGSFQLRGTVAPGTRHALETSFDLRAWSQLAVITSTDGAISFTDASLDARRFYRLKQLD